jgi:prefoldin subunit 5
MRLKMPKYSWEITPEERAEQINNALSSLSHKHEELNKEIGKLQRDLQCTDAEIKRLDEELRHIEENYK